MSVRRTAVLAAVLVLLAAYYFTFETEPLEPAGPDWAQAAKIVDCGEGEVSAVRVTTAEGARLEARRRTGRWAIDPAPAAPRQAETAVDDLAKALCTLPVIETIPEPGSLAAFGLDEPPVEVRIEADGGETIVRIGALTPARNFLYVARGGSPSVLKVGALVRSEVDKVLQHARLAPQTRSGIEPSVAGRDDRREGRRRASTAARA